MALSNVKDTIISHKIGETRTIDSLNNQVEYNNSPPTRLIYNYYELAILKTALAEEIFFRGFVSKLIIKYLGFKFGIIIQAAVFSIIHLLLFLSVTDNILFLSYSLIFPFVFSIVAVYINERKADGSILPSFLMHGITNFATYLIVIYAL